MSRWKDWLIWDLASTVAAMAAMRYANSPWWLYVAVIVFAMIQKGHGMRMERREAEKREQLSRAEM